MTHITTRALSLAIAVALPVVAQAQYRAPAVPPPPPPMPTRSPDYFQLDGTMVEGTIGGMRDYVETLRDARPYLYRRLDARLSSLETRRWVGYTLVVGGLAAGVALYFATRPSYEDKQAGTASYTGEYVGLGVAVTLPLVGMLMIPGNDAVADFVRYRNRIASDPEVRLAPFPTRDGRGGGLGVVGRF
jgi:hypothetical protein